MTTPQDLTPVTPSPDGSLAGDAPVGGSATGAGRAPVTALLEGRPVAEHVAVYEAEHERLQRQLATIDQL